MKRIFLFLLTNFLVVMTINIVMQVFGLHYSLAARGVDYRSLLVFCLIWGFAGSLISLAISRWSAKMAMGVHLIDPTRPRDQTQARLVRVVTELSRKAGLDTLPEIGIYESREVNAFATGPTKRRSLLAVSTGLLDSMDDKAVEGVLGHELAHIANGDMVTMTLLQGLVNAFVMFFARVAIIFIENAMRRDDDRGGERMGYFMRYMVVSLLETVLFLLASPIIYWFSRHREYRADSGSADLTHASTMIHALKSLQRTSKITDDRAPALATFKIHGRPQGIMQRLFSSHPPLEKRIEALERRRTSGPLS